MGRGKEVELREGYGRRRGKSFLGTDLVKELKIGKKLMRSGKS